MGRGAGGRNRRQSPGVQSHTLLAANRASEVLPTWGSDPRSKTGFQGESPDFLCPQALSPTRDTQMDRLCSPSGQGVRLTYWSRRAECGRATS